MNVALVVMPFAAVTRPSLAVGLLQANLRRAGLDAVVEIRRGLALNTLPQLAAEKRPPFDLVFIDADKLGLGDEVSFTIDHVFPPY